MGAAFVVPGLSCSDTYGIFLDQVHWQVDSATGPPEVLQLSWYLHIHFLFVFPFYKGPAIRIGTVCLLFSFLPQHLEQGFELNSDSDKYLLNEHMYVHCNILYVFNCLKWWSLCYQLSFVLIIIILLKTYLIIRNKWLLIRKRLIYPTIMEGQRCARHGREMNKQSQFFHGKICNWE